MNGKLNNNSIRLCPQLPKLLKVIPPNDALSYSDGHAPAQLSTELGMQFIYIIISLKESPLEHFFVHRPHKL